jgi:uncharacterized alpha-E superfamily protein
MHMNSIIAHPNSEEKWEALKAFMNALKIPFEVSKEASYNPDFVAKIKKSEAQFEKGDFKSVEAKDLQNLLGL